MSIKPRFGEEILAGVKKFELRRLFSLVEPGSLVFLYFTKPVGAVVGRFRAGVVFVVPVGNLGRLLSELGVGEEDLRYAPGGGYVLLIEVREPRRCKKAVSLGELGVRPPRSYLRLERGVGERLLSLCDEDTGPDG
ncbi:MAG: hypothetical protein ABWK05_03230 [Pyrobaculum sp.]